jgi:hypothetical protein
MRQLSSSQAHPVLAWIEQQDWDCFASCVGDPDLGPLSHLLIREQVQESAALQHAFYIVTPFEKPEVLATDDVDDCRRTWDAMYASSCVASTPEIYETLPEVEHAISEAQGFQVHGSADETLARLRRAAVLLNQLIERVDKCLEGDRSVGWPQAR